MLEKPQLSASERPQHMPKAAAIHYSNVCHGRKSRSRSVKKQRLWQLPHTCHSAKCERSRSSRRHTGNEKL